MKLPKTVTRLTDYVSRFRQRRPGQRCTVAGSVRAVARALSSRRFVVYGLGLVIALELCVLGIGVVRRLEVAAARTEHAAEVYMAAVEAQAFGEQLHNRPDGSAEISANSGTAPADPQPEPTADGGAPPLQPRDVNTIVWEETGVDITDYGTGEPTAPAATPAEAEPTDAAGNKLSADDAEELDRLIRKAVTAMVAGDMRLCILCLEQGRTLSPEHPALLYYYGMAYDKLLNPDKARDYYTQVFRQRDKAGKYFERASRRLTYGLAQPSAMRGKLSFGPPLVRHSYDDYTGDTVTMRLPIMLAPGEEVRVEDILIRVRFFVLINNRRIEFSESYAPQVKWENAAQTFEHLEENLIVTYNLPVLNEEEQGVYGTRRYYGYTAKLYYRGEPLDCMSSPSALILHEQMLDARNARERMQIDSGSDLLPDDGLAPDDGLVPEFTDDALPLPEDGADVEPTDSATGDEEGEATPFSRFIEEIDPD